MPLLSRTNQRFQVQIALDERIVGAWFFCGDRHESLQFRNTEGGSEIDDAIWLKRSGLFWIKVVAMTTAGRTRVRRFFVRNQVLHRAAADRDPEPSRDRNPSLLPRAAAEVAPAPARRRPHGERRVAILTNQLLDPIDRRARYGGGERYALELARLLRQNGCEVRFFQPAREAFDGEYHDFPVTAFRATGERFGEFFPGDCSHFTRLVADYDHVVHNLPEYASGLVRADALLVCHGIWFDHDRYPGAKFRTEPWFRHLADAFGRFDRIVSVDTNALNFIRCCWPERASAMRYICNFVDTAGFCPAPGRRDATKLTVLFPRRSHINRGSRILGDILAEIPHDVAFYWIGDGEAEDNALIRDLARQDPRLTYASASFDEMPAWYAKADIVVIPTLACEGTSLSCLEALASGCATVSTHVGGLPDLIFPEINGLLVSPEPREIARAINRLIEDPGLRNRLRSTAAETSGAFSLERWRGQWVALLREMDWIPPAA